MNSIPATSSGVETPAMISSNFVDTPFWWHERKLTKAADACLPAKADVVVVGGGYTGLSAALTLARNGASVVVVDSLSIGNGASSRNAGYIGRHFDRSLKFMFTRFGEARALAMIQESADAYDFTLSRIAEEEIDCHLDMNGRVFAACKPAHYDEMGRELDRMRRYFDVPGEMVPRHQQHQHLGSDYYHGVKYLSGVANLQPALYVDGLAAACSKAGVHLFGETEALDVAGGNGLHCVKTSRGNVAAQNVLIATNGYSRRWMASRIIPVPAYMIVTEELPERLIRLLIPGGATVLDTKTNIYWTRTSPDGRRIIFGSRSGIEAPPETKAVQLREDMLKVFPELSTARVVSCWSGLMGFTFDKMPHMGIFKGMHYSIGCCGSGIPLATWFGHKAALRILGKPGGETTFGGGRFPSLPLYNGRAWFLPAVVSYFNLKDRLT